MCGFDVGFGFYGCFLLFGTGGHLGFWYVIYRVVEFVVVVILRNVAGLERSLSFRTIFRNDMVLNEFAAGRVDGMGNVRIELGSTVLLARLVFESCAAVVAIGGAQMVLAPTLGAVRC